jgi:hypothetical protein
MAVRMVEEAAVDAGSILAAAALAVVEPFA